MRHRRHTMRSASLFACIAVTTLIGAGAVGCSSAKSTPTSNDYDDVAQATAALSVQAGGGGEIGSMYASANLAVGITPGNVTVDASGSFNELQAGVDYTFTISCTDVSGAVLSHCGPTTNDAQASVSWSGDLSLPGFTATVNRQGNWTLSGVQLGAATFNGSGSFTFATQFQSLWRNEQASANLSYASSYNGVTYSTVAQHATGGSIHYTVDASDATSGTNGQSSGSFTIDALLAFNPDGSATLTLDGAHTYSISASGVVIKI
jgi:hypothetical protein